MSKVNAIPEGFNSVSAYLIVPSSDEALKFYCKAFGAEEVSRMTGPDGESVVHAEMRIGNSMVMLGDENPQWEMKGPKALGGSPVSLHIYVEDADAVYKQALEAGATEKMPLSDAFWGDRYGKLTDPFGHEWGIATHIEDVTPEQMAKRQAEFFASMSQG